MTRKSNNPNFITENGSQKKRINAISTGRGKYGAFGHPEICKCFWNRWRRHVPLVASKCPDLFEFAIFVTETPSKGTEADGTKNYYSCFLLSQTAKPTPTTELRKQSVLDAPSRSLLRIVRANVIPWTFCCCRYCFCCCCCCCCCCFCYCIFNVICSCLQDWTVGFGELKNYRFETWGDLISSHYE